MTEQYRDTTERDTASGGSGLGGPAGQPSAEGVSREQHDLSQTPGKFTDDSPVDAATGDPTTATAADDARPSPLSGDPATPTRGYAPDAPGVPSGMTGPPIAAEAAQAVPVPAQTGGLTPSTRTEPEPESGGGIAGAKEQVKQVAQETGAQARGLLDTTTRELTEQASTQQQRIAGTLHTLADDLATMRGGEGGDRMAGELLQQVSERAHQAADWLEHRQPGAILDEVRDYARRHPGTFLLGALAAGLVVGRLTRNIASSSGSSDGSPGDSVMIEHPTGPATRMVPERPATAAGLTGGPRTPDDLASTARIGGLEQESGVAR
ncbi:hypothetical protein QEZ54_06950 [Catellatospora sp. KI3]|uniref:hypothetical protein n=1 Tax=Catellatospora sp. KI3 TaxID=3041620 RepID=UPI002482CCF5|nr:hypothetical protein [Catellatospora sp. KI3]MDI1460697.1 hypothetical protein [Catellatospora sp. KI3]